MEMVFSEGHELFTKLISVIPDAVLLTDMNGKIIFVNDIGVNVIGYSSAKKLIGKDALSFVIPNNQQKAKKNLARMLKTNINPNEYTIITEDGSHTPMEIHGSVLRNADGSPFARVHVCRDISERKKAEDALAKSEYKLRAILDRSPDAILIADKNGYVVDSNLNARELFGYSKKEFLGMHFSKLHPREELERIRAGINRVARKKMNRLGDVHIQTKKGPIIDVDINGAYIELEDQPLWVGIFREMTDYKKKQASLEKAKKELDATISERTMELMEANTALKVLLSHQNQEKAENEEKLSMNLRNQIMPYLQELKKKLPSEKRKAYIQLIEKNLQSVMSEFLTHLKSSASKLTPKEIQVSSLIKEGMSTKEIARFLNVSRKTVDIFRYNIRKKLGLNNRKESLMVHLLSL